MWSHHCLTNFPDSFYHSLNFFPFNSPKSDSNDDDDDDSDKVNLLSPYTMHRAKGFMYVSVSIENYQ